MDNICERIKCTGCSACFNICSKHAIRMLEDQHGFVYPQIDSTLCIDCGLCKKICPANNPVKLVYPTTCYAAAVADQNEHATCASGGLATELSKIIINRNGAVYGCSGNDIRNVHHIRVEKHIDLHLLKGSKYVQSHIGSTYQSVKNDLELGRMVLFVGTPCQVAGLHGYLFHKEFKNLITVDLVCHGVPSQKMLNDNIQYYCSSDETVEVAFRRKVTSVAGREASEHIEYGWFYKTSHMKNYCGVKPSKDAYMSGFLNMLIFRESCYNCRYACIARCGDFTLADFWGLGQDAGFANGRGVSAVLINTEKAIELWKSASLNCKYAERDTTEALKGNGRLQTPSKMPRNYRRFMSMYPHKDFKTAVFSCMNREKYKQRIHYLKMFLKG